MIPGRDRRRAVIMADHYDTAYMEDCYEKDRGGNGARLAAAGADDNHSATAALMLGAPVFLELSRAGRLACDVWLVHLTGEEFPSDCMGARHLAQGIVERSLRVRRQGARKLDLSKSADRGRLRARHDRAQQRARPRRVPDFARHGTRFAAVGVSRPRGQRDLERQRSRVERASRPARLRARPAQRRRQASARHGAAPVIARRGPSAARSPQFALQHRRPDILRRRHSRRAVHGELRHQSGGLSRHA